MAIKADAFAIRPLISSDSESIKAPLLTNRDGIGPMMVTSKWLAIRECRKAGYRVLHKGGVFELVEETRVTSDGDEYTVNVWSITVYPKK